MIKNDLLKQKYFDQVQDICISIDKIIDAAPSEIKDCDDMVKQLKILYTSFDLIFTNINPASNFTVEALTHAISAIDKILEGKYEPVSEDDEEGFIVYTMDFLEKVKFNAEEMLKDMPNYLM